MEFSQGLPCNRGTTPASSASSFSSQRLLWSLRFCTIFLASASLSFLRLRSKMSYIVSASALSRFTAPINIADKKYIEQHAVGRAHIDIGGPAPRRSIPNSRHRLTSQTVAYRHGSGGRPQPSPVAYSSRIQRRVRSTGLYDFLRSMEQTQRRVIFLGAHSRKRLITNATSTVEHRGLSSHTFPPLDYCPVRRKYLRGPVMTLRITLPAYAAR